jgi:hypothetical protein
MLSNLLFSPWTLDSRFFMNLDCMGRELILASFRFTERGNRDEQSPLTHKVTTVNLLLVDSNYISLPVGPTMGS